jgi:predicted Ser/Thr protein kinase
MRCPDDRDLLPLAQGWELPAEISAHVEECGVCRNRVEALRAVVATKAAAQESTRDSEQANDLIDRHAVTLPVEKRESVKSAAPSAGTAAAAMAMIGRYRVLAPLGSGGQAAVYRVVHPTLNLELVAKLSHWPVEEGQIDRDGLVAEGKLLAELNHPNVARVIDLDFHDDRPFLVMEYVRGRNLRQFANGQTMPAKEAARLLAQVARGIAPAHALGIVHRDLKPQNIVIEESGRPRIIDFGVALLRGAWRDDSAQNTGVSGTAAYMAPEQARGEEAQASPQADIFSLGAILYELLTGKPPFAGANWQESLRRAQRCDFDREALRESGAPAELAGICLQAMSERPEKRQANAEALAAELDRFTRPRRVPFLWPLAATIALAVTAGIVGRSLLWNDRVPQAVEPFQELVQVERDERPLPLHAAAPLVGGDQIQIRCEIPAGWQASIFWLGSDGQLMTIPPEEVDQSLRAGKVTQIYPKGRHERLGGAAGTEVALVCAAPGGRPDPRQIAACFEQLDYLKPWPELPRNTLVVMNQDRLEVREAGLGGAWRPLLGTTESGAAEVERRLDQVRQRLRKAAPFLAAVAAPHVE